MFLRLLPRLQAMFDNAHFPPAICKTNRNRFEHLDSSQWPEPSRVSLNAILCRRRQHSCLLAADVRPAPTLHSLHSVMQPQVTRLHLSSTSYRMVASLSVMIARRSASVAANDSLWHAQQPAGRQEESSSVKKKKAANCCMLGGT